MHINRALKFVYVVGLITVVTTYLLLIIITYNMLHIVSMATTGYKFYRSLVFSILRIDLKHSCTRYIAVTNFTNIRSPSMPKFIPVLVKNRSSDTHVESFRRKDIIIPTCKSTSLSYTFCCEHLHEY
jgi:hypothetical protein